MKKRLWRLPSKKDPDCIKPDCEDAAQMGQGDSIPENPSAPVAFTTEQINKFIASLERLGLAEYVRYAEDKKRMLFTNFLGGLARGVGSAIGFTILGAIVVMILQDLAKRNLPLIGDVLAEIVTVVQNQLK